MSCEDCERPLNSTIHICFCNSVFKGNPRPHPWNPGNISNTISSPVAKVSRPKKVDHEPLVPIKQRVAEYLVKDTSCENKGFCPYCNVKFKGPIPQRHVQSFKHQQRLLAASALPISSNH